MDKDKLIKYLKSACAETDGLAQSDVDLDNVYYTGQFVMANRILDFVEKGFFDIKEE